MLFMSCCRSHFLLTVYCMLPEGNTDFLHSVNTWCRQYAGKMVSNKGMALNKPIHFLLVTHLGSHFKLFFWHGTLWRSTFLNCPHTALFQFIFSAIKILFTFVSEWMSFYNSYSHRCDFYGMITCKSVCRLGTTMCCSRISKDGYN